MAIIVYSKPACQFCDKAKALLTQLHYEYTEMSLVTTFSVYS